MIYVFLADGCEPVEAIAPIDFFGRAGVEFKTVAVNGRQAVSKHGVGITADMNIDELQLDDTLTGVVLPGGMPGTNNLYACEKVREAVKFADDNGKLVCAICAAPYVLGELGVLAGKKATCYPGFEKHLKGAVVTDAGVVADGNAITARGAGVAWQFGAAIAAAVVGKEKADEVLSQIQWIK